MVKIFKSNFLKKIISFTIRPFVERKELQKGVSALVCCRDEEYNVSLCLESLIGLVDQIVCVDHNSSDSTFDKMMSFQKKYSSNLKIIVKQFKEPSLKDARNYGLKFVEYNWLLNCGGDFIFDTKNNEVQELFSSLKKSNDLAAYRLSFVNLYGDLRHTYRNSIVIGKGENYIVKLIKGVQFVEKDKFDYIAFPRYYHNRSSSTPFFFHLSGLKSDERLIYRNCYFEWREIVNFLKGKKVEDSPFLNFEYFSKYWNDYLFQTNELNSLKYRYMRQLYEISIKKFDEEKYKKYPNVIQDIIDSRYERFEVQYKNDKPFIRVDKEDEGMKSFEPSNEDLKNGITTIEDKLENECKFYRRLDNLFGEKQNVIPKTHISETMIPNDDAVITNDWNNITKYL
jgi:hypothetical protein